MADFKKPFKAVPLKSKRLRGLDEFDKPLWNPARTESAIRWSVVAIGFLIGVSLGVAYLLGGA